MTQAIQDLMREISVQEESWSFRIAQKDFSGGEENYWFERTVDELRRSFSVWRFFKITASRVSVMWRVAVALGRGPVTESFPFLTWTSPREYEIYSFRMDPQGLQLSYFDCDSLDSLRSAANRFFAYRHDNFEAMLSLSWRGLGSVIEGNGYLPQFRRLSREALILPMIASGDVEAIRLVQQFVMAVDLGWTEMRSPPTDESSRTRDLCGLGAVKFFYDRREIANTADAVVAYRLGGVWFDNRNLLEPLDAEMWALIQSANSLAAHNQAPDELG